MNFGFLKRTDKLDRAFEDLQSGMMDALQEDLEKLPFEPAEGETIASSRQDESAPVQREDGEGERIYLDETPEAESMKRLTAYAQNRLAALASFEDLHQGAEDQLQTIGSMLAEVITSHHLTREFLNTIHPEIHRANELELANATLAAENRKLVEQLHETAKKSQEQESAVANLQRRELTLQQDKETLRIAVSAAKLQIVEASNALARSEAERGELAKSLATRTVEAEKRLRENEILREKQVNLSIDLDKALKRETETRRKYDEVSALHAGETARSAEALAALTKSEKDISRLQKSLESAQAKQEETAEALRTLEADSDAEAQRNLAETRGLRSEIQNLNSRLEATNAEIVNATDEITRLKEALSDTHAEKQIVEKQFALLKSEQDDQRRNLSPAEGDLSESDGNRPEQAPDQAMIEMHKQESDELRAEISRLAAELKKLAPYERLYRAEKAKRRNSARPSSAETSSRTSHRGKTARSATVGA
jgi:chromosome segregation ATPase